MYVIVKSSQKFNNKSKMKKKCLFNDGILIDGHPKVFLAESTRFGRWFTDLKKLAELFSLGNEKRWLPFFHKFNEFEGLKGYEHSKRLNWKKHLNFKIKTNIAYIATASNKHTHQNQTGEKPTTKWPKQPPSSLEFGWPFDYWLEVVEVNSCAPPSPGPIIFALRSNNSSAQNTDFKQRPAN